MIAQFAALLKEWSAYLPPLTREPDFDRFWAEARAESQRAPLQVTRTALDYPLGGVAVSDVTYRGTDGTRIHGWFLTPAARAGQRLPCLVHYHGYGGDRGRPVDFLAWLTLGMAVLSVDCRDQSGETGNAAAWSGGSLGNHFLRGILDPAESYVRCLCLDALRALDVACAQPEVAPDGIVVEGGSQGGALTVTAAALDPRPVLALPDVPSNSDLASRVLNGNGVYGTLAEYLKRHPERTETCLRTLSYFDTMNMAEGIRARLYVSVGGRDPVCPAKCFFATYNRIRAPKDMEIYWFNGHEGGGVRHFERKLRVAQQFLAARSGQPA
ncbi:MAG: Cephalosporin-C deacetylase [Lentisphaerae bacterium ADurb.BinA184]|nr:MAG: Cephalosporin-C deacetylase [Lentisphaerae bacterium ADurb.BinA184]